MDPPKKPPSTPTPPAQDSGFEFEYTDLEEARRILDTESLSQFDVATIVPDEYWKAHRRRKLPTDRALTGQAIDWLIELPPGLRPESLSQKFPRIVNALAEVWHDADRCQAALERLLHDTRKGRQGFPDDVAAEISALRDWTQPF